MNIQSLGRTALGFVHYLGELAVLFSETCSSVFTAPIRWKLFIRQVLEVGFRSQLVVIVTGGFTGAVFAYQTYLQFHKVGMDSAVGAVVAVSMFRELGPVLTGLMVAGRVGAAIAAEIGTMKVTEQIDALRSLGVHPIDYLVVPRTLALLLSMPLLVAESCALGILASIFVGTRVLDISEAYFISTMVKFAGASDISMAMIKGFVFALIVVFVSCHQGLNTKNGAVGVGRAPTEAVVISSLLILVINFFLSFALNILYPVSS
jgi:phospholipid/cholesterol/gamma-HCH transport system permease protein